MKSHSVADPEVEHLRVGAHLIQEPQTRDDTVVQTDQIVLAEFVAVDIRDDLRIEFGAPLEKKSIELGRNCR